VAWFALSSPATPTAVPGPPHTAVPSSRAAATTAATTPKPARDVPVPSWVPRAIASTCRARAGRPPSERVVVDCAPARGIATLRYRELTGPKALTIAFLGRRPTERGGTGPSRCANGLNDERAWSDADARATTAGRYRCTRPHGRAHIEWTDEALHVIAVATRSDGDLRSLYAWWTTVPGPVESTPDR
jgi:hypothetical protein